ncbi:MAG: hypothetical protein WDA75_11755 [Candidatus Latescibacterota bacterium]|jgi:hypothetical protein
MANEGMVAVRLSADELVGLDRHTKGQLTRAAIVRILVQDFLAKSDAEQREYLVGRLFGTE